MAARQSRTPVDKKSPEYLTQQIASGRGTLLGIIILTALNEGMLLANTGRYFLFSASIPYYLTWFGKILDNGTDDGSGTIIARYTIIAILVSVVILGVYLLCWFLSKKRIGWLTAATALFAVDTVLFIIFAFTVLAEPMRCLLDFLLHAVALYQMIAGVVSHGKLRKLQAAAPVSPEGYRGTTPEL